jgi:hypothetical protein
MAVLSDTLLSMPFLLGIGELYGNGLARAEFDINGTASRHSDISSHKYTCVCVLIGIPLYQGCVVSRSSLHGYGVFAGNTVIDGVRMISPFPGDVVDRKPPPCSYSIRLFNMDMWVEAKETVGFMDGVGHLLNTCHHLLRPPFNEANCAYVDNALKQPVVFIESCGPPILPHTELLVDYHFYISCELLPCTCADCVDNIANRSAETHALVVKNVRGMLERLYPGVPAGVTSIELQQEYLDNIM